MADNNTLLEVKNLTMHFPVTQGIILQRQVGAVRAVDGIDFVIKKGETLGLVGESGCGKSTTGRAILQLYRPTAGEVIFEGQDLCKLQGEKLRQMRRRMQMIFQDPYASLNPKMRIVEILQEGMQALGIDAEPQRRIDALLDQVGLSAEAKWHYPHEFSGGQRQRIAIARALAVNPQLLICDEPTSALDVSVQAQIINLLQALQQELRLSYLFITHNLAVVEYLAHEVCVMYLGRIVERGPVAEVLHHAQHPYTQALLAAVPRIDGQQRQVVRVAGDLPSPANPPQGCHFHPRCPHVMPVCRERYPQASGTTHVVHCHLYGEPGTS